MSHENQTAALRDANAEQESSLKILNRVSAMLQLQHEMNRKVHPDWIAQRFEWYRAAWIECAELMDHLGYKWWKHHSADEEQVRLEIIDIWHFAMSSYFSVESTSDLGMRKLCEQVAQELALAQKDAVLVSRSFSTSDWSTQQCKAIQLAAEAVAAASLAEQRVPVPEFWRLLLAAGMDLDTLYQAYVGKNVLNFFRQDNGYKDGSYKKSWQGREDNEHLSEIIATLDPDADNYRQAVYGALAARYAEALAQ